MKLTPPHAPPPLLTPAELAERLRCSGKTLRRVLAAHPSIVPVVVGKRRRYTEHHCRRLRLALGKMPLVAVPARPTKLGAPWRTLYANARRRAGKHGVAFTLSEDDMRAMVARAAGACEVTGIAFSSAKAPHSGAWPPFAPSIDRVDSAQGYSAANCRLVCCAVNIAMGAWGEATFWQIVEAARRRGAPQ